MGSLGRLINFLGAHRREQREIIESYRREFEGYDDGHLRQIFRTAVSAEVKKAAGSVLRERGRSPEE